MDSSERKYKDLTTPYEVDLKNAQEGNAEFWKGIVSVVVIFALFGAIFWVAVSAQAPAGVPWNDRFRQGWDCEQYPQRCTGD